MRTVAEHLERARHSTKAGSLLLEGGFPDMAGREAYMAAFHAALAYIVSVTGKEPRTHHGTHTELARVARDLKLFPREYVAFVSRSYEIKDIADYTGAREISPSEAQAALEVATQVISCVEGLLAGPPDRPAEP